MMTTKICNFLKKLFLLLYNKHDVEIAQKKSFVYLFDSFFFVENIVLYWISFWLWDFFDFFAKDVLFFLLVVCMTRFWIVVFFSFFCSMNVLIILSAWKYIFFRWLAVIGYILVLISHHACYNDLSQMNSYLFANAY